MCWIVVVPDEDGRVAAPFLPLHDVRHRLVVGKVCVAVEVDSLAQDGSDVLRIIISVAKHCNTKRYIRRLNLKQFSCNKKIKGVLEKK